MPQGVFEHEWKRAFGDYVDPNLMEAAGKALEARRQDWENLPSPVTDLLKHSYEDAIALVQKRSRQDFAADRIVSVKNWLISRTEAELILLLGTY